MNHIIKDIQKHGINTKLKTLIPKDPRKTLYNITMLLILSYMIGYLFYTFGYQDGINIEYQCSSRCTRKNTKYGYYGLYNQTPICICSNNTHGYILDTVKIGDNRLLTPLI